MTGRHDGKRLGPLAKRQAALLQHYKLSERRAVQLGEDIAPLNEAVLELARRLRFEDEPSAFRTFLLRQVSKSGRRR